MQTFRLNLQSPMLISVTQTMMDIMTLFRLDQMMESTSNYQQVIPLQTPLQYR